MKKFLPCCLSILCFLTAPSFGSCGNAKKADVSQVHELSEDIFKGNYKTISEAELSAYAIQAKPFSLQTLFANEKGLIVREKGITSLSANTSFNEIVGTMKMVKAQTASSPTYEVLYTVEQTEPQSQKGILYSLYDDAQFAYIREMSNVGNPPKTTVPNKGLAFYASFSKMAYFSIHKVAEDMQFDIFSLLAASKAKETVHEESDEKMQITEDEIYRDTSNSDYVKIKIAFAYEQKALDEKESSTASMQIFFVYNSRTHEPVAYHFSLSTRETKRGNTTSIGVHFSIAPYEGSITPPDDLDSYIKAE